MPSKYNKLKHVLVEQPQMKEPEKPEEHSFIDGFRDYNSALHVYYSELAQYKQHIASLRTIPCQPGSIWEEDRLYEEGVDYKVLAYLKDGKTFHDMPSMEKVAIPIPKEHPLEAAGISYRGGELPKEDDLWKELLATFATGHSLITIEIAKGNFPSAANMAEQVINNLKKSYTITKKTV